MKRAKNGLFLLFIIASVTVFLIGLDIGCMFKYTLDIPCPGCGLTRSFREIVNFRFLTSFKYNILGLPIFAMLLLTVVSLIKDIIVGQDSYVIYIDKIFKKYYLFLITLILISWVVNILRGI